MREEVVVINEANIELLLRLDLFREFAPEDIERVFKDSRLLRLRRYDAGETVIAEGTFDSWTFVLISGRLRVLHEDEELAAFSRMGDVVGEWGPIKGKPRSAHVLADEDTLLLALDLSLLDHLPGDDDARHHILDFCNSLIDARFLSGNASLATLRQNLAIANATVENLQREKGQLTARVRDMEQEKGLFQEFLEVAGLQDAFARYTRGEFTFEEPRKG
jgi:CRP-like cAMP-binding protein